MLRSIKYGLHGAVVAGLIAAPVVWMTVDKSVHLVVDGQASTVSTTAARVGEVLADRRLKVSAHDLLAPSSSTHVIDGMHVVLRRGRLLHLNVDGVQTDVWTTAPTVDEALAQLGYTTNDFVSVSRSRRLPLGVTDIAIRTPRPVTVIHDGLREQLTTTDATVEELLVELGVTPGPSDRVSVPVTSTISAGEVITVQRVGTKTETRIEVLKYRTSHRDDATLSKGTTQVAAPGRDGKARVTYSVVYVDGQPIGRTQIDSVILAEPRTMVVDVGTKSTVPAATGSSGTGYPATAAGSVPSAGTPDPGSAKDIARKLLLKHGWGADQYDCLVQMWNHESGWRVNAANPSGAYGIPQALPGSKMSSAGADWQTNATTQITWGLGYIQARYNTPCGAWSFWQAHSYY